jgi:hypothetical protein
MGDPYGRQFLLNAATGLVMPGFSYARSGPALLLPQQDGSLASFPADALPRSWGPGGWGFEFHAGWTQYITRTHEFSHATWTKRRASVVPVSMPTPDGLNTAFKVVEDTTAANSHYIESEFVAIAATRGCFVVKAGEVTEIGIRFIRDTGVSFGGANTRMNLLTGEVTLGTLTVEALSGGWWKVTGLPDGTATTNVSIRLSLVKSGSETYTGDGSSGIFVMAANLTSTLYPVPLTAAAGAVGTIGTHTMGATLSGLGVTLGAEYGVGVESVLSVLIPNYQPIAISISNNTFNESIYQNAATLSAGREPNWAVIDENVGQANSMGLGPATVVGQLRKTAVRVRANDFRSAFNGVLTFPDTAGTLPTVDRVFIGLNWSGTSPNAFQGRITRAYLIPNRAPSDAELAAMTA